MIVFVQVALILAVARLARALIVPLGQPAVMGEMIAGLLLGPSLFGWLLPEWSAALFAPSSLRLLSAMSQAGLILFMFLVGLRLHFDLLKPRRRMAAVISGASIVLPFALGMWLASVVRDRLAPPDVATWPFMLFVGVALSITAFPVLARILVDRRLMDTEVGVMAIACAAFDDVTGWMILAGIMTLVSAGNLGLALAGRAFLFVGYLSVMVLIVRPLLARQAHRRGSDFGRSSLDVLILLTVMAVSAAATDAIGVHALFGAFFAGLMVPRQGQAEQGLSRRIEPLTMIVLLPLFFAFTGLRTSVQLIDTPSLWRDAALIMSAAVAGKLGGSTIAARVMGFNWRKASALGVLLNTRGLIELVVLNIGLDLGILSPVIFSMLVLMALATTLMASPLVVWLMRREAGAA